MQQALWRWKNSQNKYTIPAEYLFFAVREHNRRNLWLRLTLRSKLEKKTSVRISKRLWSESNLYEMLHDQIRLLSTFRGGQSFYRRLLVKQARLRHKFSHTVSAPQTSWWSSRSEILETASCIQQRRSSLILIVSRLFPQKPLLNSPHQQR